MDYMMAGRPIIAALRAGNNPVAEHDCGLTAPPDDPGAVALAVKSMSRAGDDARQIMGSRGREAVVKQYSYDVLASRFASLFCDQFPS
jgi:glycosyltransferase involved in cell wall biosynthesis